MTSSTQIQLIARPVGWPTHNDFATVKVDLSDVAPGEIRVANEFLSVDPYMRGRMNDVKSYIPPFALGETMTGGAVGRVIESSVDSHPVGAVVLHDLGWRDIAQGDAARFRVVPEIPGVPISAYLGVFGMTGLTAYVGLRYVAEMKAGDIVFISGAAGAVGAVAGQIARLLGASSVIGSAGSDDKVALLKQKYGYDIAFNYKGAPVRDQLVALAADGIDVYFDNVGGDHLEAAIAAMRPGGRGALCGAIAAYNDTVAVPGPDNLARMIWQGLTLRGFIVGNYYQHAPEFQAEMGAWLASGKVVYDETIVDGVENSVDAFLRMMQGGNIGKMLVRVHSKA